MPLPRWQIAGFPATCGQNPAALPLPPDLSRSHVMKTMKAVVFKGKDRIAIEEVPKPTPRAGEAVIRITTTTICGTDVHIVRGEYPVRPGLVIGHEPVGVIEELG